MVEILKKGIPPEERKYTLHCNNCKTQFRFQRSEAKHNSDQRDGDYLSINCPICKRICTIDVKLYDRTPGAIFAWDR